MNQIKFKGTPDQIELIKKVGSLNKVESNEALFALAKFIGPVIQEHLDAGAVAAPIFENAPYDADSDPSYSLDVYHAEDAGYVSVWSSTEADGIATNFANLPVKEMKFMPYTLNSAVSWSKKQARKARLDLVAAHLNRMANEILIKQERNAFNVIMAVLATGATKNGRSVAQGTSGSLNHVVRSAGATFQLKDLSDLMVRIKKLNTSYAGTTPAGFNSKGLTDLYFSPDVEAQIREFSFNPIRSDSSASTTNTTSVPNSARESIYAAAGAMSLFNVSLHPMVELGTSAAYNTLFDSYASSTSYTRIDSTNGSTFAGASDEIIVGIDNSRRSFIRPVSVNENGSTVSVLPDDQFLNRNEKAGVYASLEECRISIDARPVVGIMLG